MAGLLPLEIPMQTGPSPMHIDLETDFPTPPRSRTASPIQSPQPRHSNFSMTSLIMQSHSLPQSMADWKRLLALVKRDYQAGKYRSCLTRCNGVLDNIRKLVRCWKLQILGGHSLTPYIRLTCKRRILYTSTSTPHVLLRCNTVVCQHPPTVRSC